MSAGAAFPGWPKGLGRGAHVTAAFWLKRASRHSPRVEHLAQVLDGVPGVDEAQVQRREAEAQDVGHGAVPSPARKSPITPRAISACTMA
jgi:hypothetical protein